MMRKVGNVISIVEKFQEKEVPQAAFTRKHFVQCCLTLKVNFPKIDLSEEYFSIMFQLLSRQGITNEIFSKTIDLVIKEEEILWDVPSLKFLLKYADRARHEIARDVRIETLQIEDSNAAKQFGFNPKAKFVRPLADVHKNWKNGPRKGAHIIEALEKDEKCARIITSFGGALELAEMIAGCETVEDFNQKVIIPFQRLYDKS